MNYRVRMEGKMKKEQRSQSSTMPVLWNEHTAISEGEGDLPLSKNILMWEEEDETMMHPIDNNLFRPWTNPVKRYRHISIDTYCCTGWLEMAQRYQRTGQTPNHILIANLNHSYELIWISVIGSHRASHSAWTSLIVLVPKKDGLMRLCVDYQQLTKRTKLDPSSMTRVEDLQDGLGGAQYISTLDLMKGYREVLVPAGPRRHMSCHWQYSTIPEFYIWTTVPDSGIKRYILVLSCV